MRTKIIFLLLISNIIVAFIPGRNKHLFSPPGTVNVSEKLFYDETEITNFHWREYVYWKKNHFGDTSAEYKMSLPDTTVWLDPTAYNQPYVGYYFSHTAYRDYPVVGITYEQAADYCKWRTARVKEYYKIRNKKSDHVPNKFHYRLPTKKEWEIMAKAGYSEKTLKSFEKKYKGMARYNVKRELGKTIYSEKNIHWDVTAPVYSYWPNSYGVWQIMGNVAEIVSEKGIAKGGGWIHREEEVTAEKEFTYDGPKSWLGFRCVCEVIEE